MANYFDKYKSRVKFIRGIASAIIKGEQSDVKGFREALAIEAQCGCGIDCCKGSITLPGKPGNANENDVYDIYVNEAGNGFDFVKRNN